MTWSRRQPGPLCSGLLLGPDAGPDTLIEGLRSEIGPARPYDSPSLGIDAHRAKPLRRASVRKDRTAHPIQNVDLAHNPIGKRESEDAMADDAGSGDVRGQPVHCSGSIAFSVSPARASRQFSNSSA